MIRGYCFGDNNEQLYFSNVNSLTAKSVPAGTKLVLFGRYVLNIYKGIVQYFLCKTKTQRAKIYLPTQCTNRRILYNINGVIFFCQRANLPLFFVSVFFGRKFRGKFPPI